MISNIGIIKVIRSRIFYLQLEDDTNYGQMKVRSGDAAVEVDWMEVEYDE